jgi:hypothetical protein
MCHASANCKWPGPVGHSRNMCETSDVGAVLVSLIGRSLLASYEAHALRNASRYQPEGLPVQTWVHCVNTRVRVHECVNE